MSYELKSTVSFERELKRLTKKFPSLKSESVELLTTLLINPTQGTAIGSGFYKIRLAIASKGKGKRGGARAITYVAVLAETVFLTTIYDNSEKENISQKELEEILKNLQL